MKMQISTSIGDEKRPQVTINGLPDELVLIGLFAHVFMQSGKSMTEALKCANVALHDGLESFDLTIQQKCKDLHKQFYNLSIVINVG